MQHIKRIAAFGAHPDDLEIGCFGALVNFIKAGAHVDLYIATGDLERIAEMTKACRHLGEGSYKIHELGYENNLIPYSKKIIQDIDRRLDKNKPDLIITHWVGDNQQDHQNLAKSVISACRKRDNIWMMEPPSGRPPVKGTFRPQVYVDISEALEKKHLAILEHESQLGRLSMRPNFNPWMCRSRLHGVSINTEAAEVFEIVKQTIRFKGEG